jgi:two-component system response regulator FixJ
MSINLAGTPKEWSEACDQIASLTDRELQVLELVALGHSSRGIAEKWAISPTTVDIHRRNLLAKLNAVTMFSAVRIAVHAALARQVVPPAKVEF